MLSVTNTAALPDSFRNYIVMSALLS